MKIIVSHDVDHLQLAEHWRDTFLPGLALRSFRSWRRREIAAAAAVRRFSWRLNRIKELHSFNVENGIPATWFFGMRTGLNLSYHWRAAKPYVQFLREQEVEVGLHGMAFDHIDQLRHEKHRIENLLEKPVQGIRNHYLRIADNTLSNMEQLGFAYDSTQSGLDPPSQIGRITEFPVALMDVHLTGGGKRKASAWLAFGLFQVEQAQQKQLPYFVIDFHDVYYSNGWPAFKEWYESFVVELRNRQFEFVNFQMALGELSA